MGTNINQLSSEDTLAGSDQLPFWSASNGDTRKSSRTQVKEWLEDNLSLTNAGQSNTQYAAPSATGFSVAIKDAGDSIHLILTPVADYADGEIVLPSVARAVDKQTVLVNSTKAVTTLVVDGNGAVAVTGEPAALAALDFFTLKYDALTKTWYRVA